MRKRKYYGAISEDGMDHVKTTAAPAGTRMAGNPAARGLSRDVHELYNKRVIPFKGMGLNAKGGSVKLSDIEARINAGMTRVKGDDDE